MTNTDHLTDPIFTKAEYKTLEDYENPWHMSYWKSALKCMLKISFFVKYAYYVLVNQLT